MGKRSDPLKGKKEKHINHLSKYCSCYNNGNSKNKRIIQKHKNWNVTGENTYDAQLNTDFFLSLLQGLNIRPYTC